MKTQFDVRIKKFRFDNAKDYFNQILSPYFQKHGIIHESSSRPVLVLLNKTGSPKRNMVIFL